MKGEDLLFMKWSTHFASPLISVILQLNELVTFLASLLAYLTHTPLAAHMPNIGMKSDIS